MNLKSLLLVGAIFIVLLLVVLRTYRAEIEEEKEERDDKELLSFDQREVEELTVENTSGKVVCQRVGAEEWKIVEPVTVAANRGAVEGVLVNILKARVKRFVEQGEELDEELLKKYGLDVPHVSVTLRGSDRVLDTVLYGDEVPSRRYVYVKKTSEDRIGLVELYRRTGVDKSFADLRSRDALKFKWVEARALRIESPRANIELAKLGEEWQMKSPIETRGEKEEIERLLQRLSYKTVQEFVEATPQSLQDYGLDPPRMRIDITGEQGDLHSLWIGVETEANFYAKDASRTPVFMLDSAFVNQLDKTVFDLRYKNLIDFKRDDIDRIEFAYPDSSMLCVRDQTTRNVWVAVPQKRTVNGHELEAILFNMEKLKAEKLLAQALEDTSRYGLNPPRMRIRAWSGDGIVGDLSIGNAEGDLVYARGSGNEFTCLVQKTIADRLMPKAERVFGQE